MCASSRHLRTENQEEKKMRNMYTSYVPRCCWELS
jgi:hypothetical protein